MSMVYLNKISMIVKQYLEEHGNKFPDMGRFSIEYEYHNFKVFATVSRKIGRVDWVTIKIYYSEYEVSVLYYTGGTLSSNVKIACEDIIDANELKEFYEVLCKSGENNG